MVRRRGDNIPSVSEYAHWNEDAERVWYEENKYDMEHADEIIEEEDDWGRDDPDPFQDYFPTEAAARAFADKVDADQKRDVTDWTGRDGQTIWYVEHYDKTAHNRHKQYNDRVLSPRMRSL